MRAGRRSSSSGVVVVAGVLGDGKGRKRGAVERGTRPGGAEREEGMSISVASGVWASIAGLLREVRGAAVGCIAHVCRESGTQEKRD
jgi:hypothetical protein